MGSDQSSHAKDSNVLHQSDVLQSPTTAALREGAMSPRQDSICSETEVPYVSYTVNKPIGESPKKVAGKTRGRFSSPRLSRSLNKSKLSSSAHNTLVTVNTADTDKSGGKTDLELVRLSQIPSFLPIMQTGGDHADILSRLDHAPLCSMLQVTIIDCRSWRGLSMDSPIPLCVQINISEYQIYLIFKFYF